MANRKDLVPYADECKYELDCARLWRPGLRCHIQYKYDNGDFLGFRERRPQNGIVLRTPRIVGSAILDLAKVHMYEFHYGFIKPTFGANARLLYTDTDSTILLIHNVKRVLDVMLRAPDLFDFSNYGVETLEREGLDVTRASRNFGVAGPFKNELVDKKSGMPKVVVEFAASEAKCYSLRYDGEDSAPYLRCKGIPRSYVENEKNEFRFETIKAAALNQEVANVSFRSIRLNKSRPVYVQISKVAVRGNNDKTHHLSSIDFIPLGHYSISYEKASEKLQNMMLRKVFQSFREACQIARSPDR